MLTSTDVGLVGAPGVNPVQPQQLSDATYRFWEWTNGKSTNDR